MQKLSRPASASGFEGLVGDGQSQRSSMTGLADGREGSEEPSSRFSRFFQQIEPSQSTSRLPDLSTDTSAALHPAKQSSLPLPGSLAQNNQAPASDANQLQVRLHAKAVHR